MIQDEEKRFKALQQEHNQYIPAYQDLSSYVNPFRGIFNGDRTKIGKMMDHKKILSAHATHALRIFASGLNSGMTSKSTQWFKLTIKDKMMLQAPGVKQWLDDLQESMYDVLNQSNIYEVFYSTYEELGQFGTGCFLVLEDYDDVIRARSFTAGEYFLGTDSKGRPNTFGREFEMTVAQVVQEFGLESCSTKVQAYHASKQLDNRVKICHLIEPNKDRSHGKEDYLNMAYKSCYWESGNHNGQYLARRGYKNFPVVAPRWDTITTDMVYGYGPGWHSLGAIKELQKTRLDKLLAQEKLHKPPMVQDSSVQGHANLLPGGVTKSSLNTPNSGVRPAYQINPNLESFIEAINEVKEEIDKFFFVNLFLMMANLDDRQRTAEEIATRQQEKIMMMGPALHRLDEEMLTITLELAYNIMQESGMIPEPPEDLEVNIEFTSILAQAQKAIGIQKIDSLILRAGNLAQLGRPDAWDNIDIDEAIRESAEMDGAPAKIIVDKAIVEKVRAERQKQQNQAIAMQAANSAADTTNKLGSTPMGTGSALDGIVAGVK